MVIVRRLTALLAATEIWVVAFFVILSFISQSVLVWAVGIALIYWPLRWLAYGRLSLRTPLDWPVGVLLAAALLTLWVTSEPKITQPQVFRLLTGIGLFYAVVNWVNTLPRLRLAGRVAVLGGIGLAGFALIGVQWSVGKLVLLPASLYARLPVLVADAANPNVMAGSLALFAALAFGIGLFKGGATSNLESGALLLAALAMSGMLFLTQSRGAMLGLIAALFVALILRWGWARPSGAALLLIGFLGLAAVGVVLWLGPAQVSDFMFASSSLGGVEGRLEVWSRAIDMIRDFPFTGIGLGLFGSVVDRMYPFFTIEPGKVTHAHHLFLQIAVDLGLPGLLAWLAAWGLTSLAAWQVYQQGRKARQAWMAGLGAGLLACQVVLAVHGQFDAVTWGMVRPAPLVWALWGLAAAAWDGVAALARRGVSLPTIETPPGASRPVKPPCTDPGIR